MLPLLRHAVLILIVVAGTIAALERLGFNIGPLLAGLGVFGIAIGFGAQTLVRDVISGVFFLLGAPRERRTRWPQAPPLRRYVG